MNFGENVKWCGSKPRRNACQIALRHTSLPKRTHQSTLYSHLAEETTVFAVVWVPFMPSLRFSGTAIRSTRLRETLAYGVFLCAQGYGDLHLNSLIYQKIFHP